MLVFTPVKQLNDILFPLTVSAYVGTVSGLEAHTFGPTLKVLFFLYKDCKSRSLREERQRNAEMVRRMSIRVTQLQSGYFSNAKSACSNFNGNKKKSNCNAEYVHSGNTSENIGKIDLLYLQTNRYLAVDINLDLVLTLGLT